MRTGFILDGNFFNDSRVKNEACILVNHGYQVYVLTPFFKDHPATSHFSDNISVIFLPFSKKMSNYLFFFENLIPLYDYFWYLGIKKFIRKYNIDVLHVHDLYLSGASAMASSISGIPLILDLHENYPAAIQAYRWASGYPSRLIVRPDRWKKKEKKYLDYASKLIVLSDHFRNSLISEYDELKSERIHVYPNVPDTGMMLSYKIDNRIFPAENKIVVFYFGVISRRRGIETSVDALRTLIPEFPEIHLLLIGPADKAEKDHFKRLFSEDLVKDHITWYPWKDISLLPSYISCSDICISPILKNAQHDSGVANKVFQYMLFGKPLLVSDCVPQMEVIGETGCGMIFKNNDPEDMSLKLSEMISDPDARRSMGKKGKKAVMEKYNTEIMGQSIIEAYTGLR